MNAKIATFKHQVSPRDMAHQLLPLLRQYGGLLQPETGLVLGIKTMPLPGWNNALVFIFGQEDLRTEISRLEENLPLLSEARRCLPRQPAEIMFCLVNRSPIEELLADPETDIDLGDTQLIQLIDSMRRQLARARV